MEITRRRSLPFLLMNVNLYWYGIIHVFRDNKRYSRRKIWLIESTAKSRHLSKFTCKGTLRQELICLRPPPFLGICLEQSSNFEGSESGQIQSVKLLQNMVSKRTQQPPLPPDHIAFIYCTLTQGRGEGWTSENARGAIVHKARPKIPTWLTVSTV